MSYNIAQRYAQALFDVCQELSRSDVVYHDLKKITQLIEQSVDLKHFLDNPIIPKGKCQIILKDIFHGKVDSLTYNFLFFLEAKRRLPHLKSICAIFDNLYQEARGVLRTKWTSSMELSAHDVHATDRYLKTKFNKDIVVEREIDPTILGGIKIQVGDTIYDYTIRTQLKEFQQRVLNA